tara:strand:- start:6032 stop:6244 length:213 start_codon:yes stop_codon:yes gene_type:complete
MPFKSEKQRKYLWANEPEIAKKWSKEYGSSINAKDGVNLSQLRKNSKNPKGVAKGCGLVMEDRRKETKYA